MANTALSKAEQNALAVSYEVMGTRVELDLDFVKRYLVRGQPEKVSDQELVFFMNTCKMQKLNPLVAGEVYCIKFGNEPAQMVVGKGAYLRRAFEHPDYKGKEDGITVLRGDEVIQKEGCCLYPNEKLIGGWCRVHYVRDGRECTEFKEVALSEYDKGQANWKTKPATMINKVAVSQCVREAFPKDYEGLYSEEELIASGAIPVTNYAEDGGSGEDNDPVITQEQRQALINAAQHALGKVEGNALLIELIKAEGYESSYDVRLSSFNTIMEKMAKEIESHKQPKGKDSEKPAAPEEPAAENAEEDGGKLPWEKGEQQ